MQASPVPLQAAHPALRELRQAQTAIAALATGPCGTEAVTIVQAIGRVLAAQPSTETRLQHGALPLTVGTVLSPTHIPLLASMRSSTIDVYARARVGVACLATGTNNCRTIEAMLSGLVNGIGAKALCTRCPSPDGRMLPRTVEMLLAGCDIVMLCGGMSDADWDGLRSSLGACSMDTPAFRLPQLEPVRIACHAGKLVVQFGEDLGAAFAAFVLLLSPLMRRLQGRIDAIPASSCIAPGRSFAADGGESLFLFSADDFGGCDSYPILGHGATEPLLLALARATGLAWRPRAGPGLAPGPTACFALDAWLS